MTLSAIILTTSELTSPSNPGSGSNFSLEILQCKFPKAQIMSLFSINNWILFIVSGEHDLIIMKIMITVMIMMY